MIKKSQKQGGSAHFIIVIILIMALIALLGFVFWKNILSKTTTKNNEAMLVDEAKDSKNSSETQSEEVEYKKFVSTTGSGLSFIYPIEWRFESPSEPLKNLKGGETSNFSLMSEEYKLDPAITSAPVTINQYFCLTFTEYKGEWAYGNSINSEKEIKSEAFEVDGVTYYIKTYSDDSLGRDGKPMGNIMRLVAGSPKDSLPLQFLEANNGYLVDAVAQFNCVQGGEGIKNLNDDFFAQPETVEAIKVLKSIRFE